MRRSYAMTGMPAWAASATDDLIAVPSCARMMRTLTPCEIRFVTLVFCVWPMTWRRSRCTAPRRPRASP